MMSSLILPTTQFPTGILPKYWFCAFDKKSQNYYYFNNITGERTWNLASVIANQSNNLIEDNPLLNTTNILPPPTISIRSKWIENNSLDLGCIIYYNPFTNRFNYRSN